MPAARFKITLADLTAGNVNQMLPDDDRIVDRVMSFKFDNPAHFDGSKFDVVFMFGFASSLGRAGTAADGNPYPTNQLAQSELQAIAEFQNGGGGLFATGDHGALGRFMGQALPRARSMRLWDSTSTDNDLDEVSMGGERRNDTNRQGDAGSQFEDQSDDIPQPIQPKMYSLSNGLFEYSYPHPLLCGPLGPIRVMPDHPHEGVCIEPLDNGQTLHFTAPAGAEFPAAVDGGPRPLPEIISTNSVLAGTRSGFKDPTIPHQFGGISAYDGHRAGIGRVVTDATWHHFVNINLLGDSGEPVGSIKSLGYMASPAGQAHFEAIKAYYRNLATWLARKSLVRCMNWRLIVKILRTDRVLEATLTTADVSLRQISPATLLLIGRHARDVLGKFAGQCQSRRLIIDLIWPEMVNQLPAIDPWFHDALERDRQDRDGGKAPNKDPILWVNYEHSLEMALGAALVTVNRALPDEPEKIADELVEKAALSGARDGLKQALNALNSSIKSNARAFDL